MSDSQKYLDKDYRVRLFLAARNALYWPLRGSDDEFEPANVGYLSTPTRALVRLAHPEAVEAILLEMDRLEKLVVDFQAASGLWHGMGETDRITPEHVRKLIHELTNERDARTKQRDELAEAMKTSAETNIQAIDRIQAFEEENKQLRKRAADAELAYNNLQMECRRLDEENKALKTLGETQEAEYRKLYEENTRLYADLGVARDTYEALVAENQQLKAALDETVATLAMAENGLKEFDERITRLERLSKEVDVEVARLQSRESYIAMLEEDLDEVLDQVDADIAEIDRLKQENARLTQASEDMVVDYGQLQLRHKEESDELRAQLAEKVRLLDIYETKYVTKTSLDIMTKAYNEASIEVERLKKELKAERTTNFGDGAWIAVEAYNKVAHALAEACDIAENWVRPGAMPFGTDPLARINRLRNVGHTCYFPPFEAAWLCEQIAYGYQYGEDALEQVRMGYEIARKWLLTLGEP